MAAIDTVGKFYAQKLNARRELEAEARVHIKNKLASIEQDFDAHVFRCKQEGAKITHIAREMQTSTPVVYACLKRAEAFSPALLTPPDPLNARYAYNPATETVTVTLTPEEVAFEFSNRNFPQRPVVNPTGRFTKFPAQNALGYVWEYQPETDTTNPTDPQPHTPQTPNPVYLWSWNEKNRKELTEWAVGK